ncbi:Adhesion G-protein coupled receptor G7 [Channa argus]|uniref:Adhesion G-protein coupled receptor G7 n=1 Tax=Channa argus TaxID=215402 RepID=A0A6G1PDE8_CHAAH|nr:Adhesion G-protein coupled receptor G7 [Channa argus]
MLAVSFLLWDPDMNLLFIAETVRGQSITALTKTTFLLMFRNDWNKTSILSQIREIHPQSEKRLREPQAYETTSVQEPGVAFRNRLQTLYQESSFTSVTSLSFLRAQKLGELRLGAQMCANFCKADKLDEFPFPSTPVGWFAYSTEICPKGTSNASMSQTQYIVVSVSAVLTPTVSHQAGKPQASTRCSTKNGSPSFDRPLQKLKCDQTLSDIQQNLTSAADLETLASSTQILTSRPEELTAENVTAAAQIVNTLLLSPNATEVRTNTTVTLRRTLCDQPRFGPVETNTKSVQKYWFEERQGGSSSHSQPTAERQRARQHGGKRRYCGVNILLFSNITDVNGPCLTLTLDQLSVNLSSSLNESKSQVVQPNLVVQSVKIPAVDTQGVQFTSLTGTSGSFVADRIQLNTNASTVVVENGFIADALIYIRFPSAATSRQQPSNVSLGFVLYQNDRFFRSRLYRSRRTSVRVLSASVRGQERSVVPQHVEMMFRPTVMNGTSLYDFACVFWNYSLEDWSTVGCSKGNASDGVLRCFCNHTTNFAALWVNTTTRSHSHNQLLKTKRLSLLIGDSPKDTISKLTSLDSLTCYDIKMQQSVYKAFNKDSIIKQGWSFRENYEYAEALGVISIIGLSISIVCLVVTIIYHIKEKIVKGDDLNSQITQLCIFVSLLAFILTFLFGVENSSRQDDDPVEFSQDNIIPKSDEHIDPDRGSCTAVAALLHFLLLATFMWNSLYGTLLLVLTKMTKNVPSHWIPVSFAAGYGVPAVIMAITLAVTYSVDDPLEYRQEEFTNCCSSKKFLQGFSVAVILGLTWVVGYLVLFTTGVAHLVLSIFFCLLTTTQGVQIFFFITFKQLPSFRTAVARSAQYISSVSIPLHNLKYRLIRNWDRTRSEFYRAKKEEATSFM